MYDLEKTPDDMTCQTFMIIDHSVMETENYRKTVRKSLAHIYGNIEAIEESGARVIEDYSSGGEGEISLSQGDRLNVIMREPTGWWLVENYETGESGWVPASYVHEESRTSTTESSQGPENGIENRAFIKSKDYLVTNKFVASSAKEISVDENCVVSVLEENVDGWWLVRYNGAKGLFPAMYLRKYDDPIKDIGVTLRKTLNL